MASAGRHIRRRRMTQKLTQEELTERFPVTRQAVSAWERGQIQPDPDTLERIAQALDTEVTALIHGPDAARDLAARKRKRRRSSLQTGIIIAVLHDILFFRGAWNPFLYGLDCQLPSEDYRVTEEVLPGAFSREADLRALYRGGEILLSKDDGGCRVAAVTLACGELRLKSLAGDPGRLLLLAALEGKPRHRRHAGGHVLHRLHHLCNRSSVTVNFVATRPDGSAASRRAAAL